MKKYKIIYLLFFFSIILIIANILQAVLEYPEKYTQFNYWDRHALIKTQYENSQYVNKNPKGWIPEEVVNAYASAQYIQGMNPIYIGADTHPFGRYIIEESILLFNNENIIILICAVLSLFLLFMLSLQIFKHIVRFIIPPLFFSFKPLYYNKILFTPLLDIIQLVFLLSSFILFNKVLISKKSYYYFIATSIFIGFFIATKFYATGIMLVGALILQLVLRNQKKIIEYIVTVPISGIIFLLTYTRSFIDKPEILPFLGIQKWIFLYYKSQLILPFTIWPLLLFNRWYVWFGDEPVISDTQWRVIWPAITIITLFTTLFYIRKKIKNYMIEICMVWIILYLIFYSIGQISSRYLIIVISIMYIVSLYGIILFLRHTKIQKVIQKYKV